METYRPASQKVSLAGVLNPDENRDSAYFSSTDASSKRMSRHSTQFGVDYRPSVLIFQ